MIQLDPSVERILGYSFQDKHLLFQALTHASLTDRSRDRRNNERLEFLGDRVLGLVIAEMVFYRFPKDREGDLSKRHVALVNGETIAQVVHSLRLGQFMRLSHGEEETGGRDNPGVLADLGEALIGAVYLDGGIAAAQRFIKANWTPLLDLVSQPPMDPKTALQEWAQGHGFPLPRYELLGRDGPDHQPCFCVRVSVQGMSPAEATGSSKRSAEKNAAEQLMSSLTGKES